MVMTKMIINGGFILFLLLLNSFTLLSYSQSSPQQNVQSYYSYTNPQPPPPTPPAKTSRRKIAVAVGATAASTLVVAGVFFLLCSTCFGARRRRESAGESSQTHPLPPAAFVPGSRSEFARFGRNVKGVIVDEDGLDVLYWRKLKDNSDEIGFRKEPFERAGLNGSGYRSNSNGNMRMETITRGRSSSSHGRIHPGQRSGGGGGGVGLPPLAPSVPPPPPAKKVPAIPPPPPVLKKKAPMPPPPPPRKAERGGPSKPPTAPKSPSKSSAAEGEKGGKDQVALKPLHWEKLNVDTDHSMVWDNIQKGSFQYNGDMMEALFGVLASNRKSPTQEHATTRPGGESPNPKTFILDPRKSHNTSIVLKSLGVPRAELTDSLLSGKGLSVEALEKLARTAPTLEEESQILSFDGDTEKLAYAESFLHALLTEVPSAFTRANAMLFRLSYDNEILGVKESLQTMELACTEMRSRVIFMKLLEAILKAGNRLNAGTARGDAKAFNLNTLLKLSDYKSSDGKTTLLHFVVHEVVRNEGRRCVMSKTATIVEDSSLKEEKEKEFLKLGLPIVGGLSSDFSNVKKASFIDYDGLKSTLACLGTRVDSTRALVAKCKLSGGDGGGGGGFLLVMKDFLETAEAEIKIIQEEHVRVMELVKKTMQYYQAAGASSESNPLQLFVIVKGFLSMVDQACVEIARSLQQKKKANVAKVGGGGSGTGVSSQLDVLRTRVTFPRLPDHFLSDKTSGSDSEDDP